eukprot:643134-Karenia_brevis.AAC.1
MKNRPGWEIFTQEWADEVFADTRSQWDDNDRDMLQATVDYWLEQKEKQSPADSTRKDKNSKKAKKDPAPKQNARKLSTAIVVAVVVGVVVVVVVVGVTGS